MSDILSVYSVHALKEFLLPAETNIETTVMLNKDIFSLQEDILIPLENVEGKWYLRDTHEMKVRFVGTDRDYQGSPLMDGTILSFTTSNQEILNMIVKQETDSFRVYQKYLLEDKECLTIGKGENCDLHYDFLNLISKEHGTIRKIGSQFVIEDGSTNGIFVNSVRIAGSRQLSFGDCMDIFGLRILFLNGMIAVNQGTCGLQIRPGCLQEFDMPKEEAESLPNESQNSAGEVFHRSPRKIFHMETEPVEIEAPPALKERDRQSLVSVIGPSLTMALPMLLGCSLAIYSTKMSGQKGGAFMYTGLITSVSSALIGTIWALVNMRKNKQKAREDELHRFEAYGEYLIKCSNTIKEKYENNSNALREMYPDTETCSRYDRNTPQLWNRNTSHADMLFERLGLGDIPFQVKIEIPKERFTMINDSLAERPKLIQQSYEMLYDVPVGIDLLKHRLVGVFGGEHKQGAISAAYNLVAQIAANNCYTDVKMAFVYNEEKYDSEKTWAFANWLPHVWSEDRKTRFVAKNKSEASDVLYELTKIFRMRQEENHSLDGTKKAIPKPYYILFVIDPELLEGELISKYIFEVQECYGLTTLLLEENYNALPNACTYLIQNDEEFTGVYSIQDGEKERIHIKMDMVSAFELEEMGRRLANIEVSEIETGGEIPTALTFLEMYHVNKVQQLNVLDRWRKNRTYESMKALIGQKTGGVDCYLDVHEKYHGPHGLVAGTTGSGKSETLQTYMLSLALNFSPDDVGFFVIDYKGGGMANLFSGLPHMIGQISNLSGNQVHRAMVSIKSENLRRQRIFNEHGVNNINLYTKMYKNKEAAIPIPHMFIIIDEFAELKREESDFMRELISVAQVGRSLGVHLILATQKPSGTVDDNIWSNSKFKLCLRVQDRQDSNDMLHKPDAAYITQAGRCYLQVGNDELYELFQSGYSGAVYNDDDETSKTDIARMITNTGKTALTGSRTRLLRKEKAKKQWIATLLELIYTAASELDINLSDMVNDYAAMDKLIQKIFYLVQQKKIEYAKNEYNEKRMEELIEVYEQCLQENIETDFESLAEKILLIAAEKNRKLPEKKEKTQLEAVVEYLAQAAEANGYTRNMQLWLPILPTELYLEELDGYSQKAYQGQRWSSSGNSFELMAYIGLYDDPVNRAQKPLILDFAENGHHAVCGTVMSGKSTFLQTLVYSMICRYSPDDVNIYGIDYGSKMLSCFEGAPHVGGIVYEEDKERLDKLLTMIVGMMEERKKLFEGGNYSQYIRVNGHVLPAVVLVIDNFGALRNKTNSMYDDFFLQLSKDGASYGIFLLMSASGFSSMEIPMRIGDNIRTSLTLEMQDKFSYADVLRVMKVNIEPEENVKGRGLVRLGESILEYQTALALRADDDFQRAEKIAHVAAEMKTAWKGKKARQIPEIPEDFRWEDFEAAEEVQPLLADISQLPIGYNMKNVAPYSIDLCTNYCYLALGKARSGKTNFLKVLIRSAAKKKAQMVIIDYRSELQKLAEEINATYIQEDKQLHAFLNGNSDFILSFKKRNARKRELMSLGYGDEEIFDAMQNECESIMIFIADLPDFMNHIYRPETGVGAMNPTVENLLDKGALHNIFWFGAAGTEDLSQIMGVKAFTLFARDKKGILLGGNAAGQRIFNFDYVPYNLQSKTEKPGVAMIPFSEEETVRKVKLPLAVRRKHD